MHTFKANPLFQKDRNIDASPSLAYRTIIQSPHPSQESLTIPNLPNYGSQTTEKYTPTGPPRLSPIRDERRARLDVPYASSPRNRPSIQTTQYHNPSLLPQQTAAMPELLTMETAFPDPVNFNKVFTEAIVPYDQKPLPSQEFTTDLSKARGSVRGDALSKRSNRCRTKNHQFQELAEVTEQDLVTLRAIREGQLRVFSSDGAVEYAPFQPRAPPQITYDVYDVIPGESRPQVQPYPQPQTWYPLSFYYTSAE